MISHRILPYAQPLPFSRAAGWRNGRVPPVISREEGLTKTSSIKPATTRNRCDLKKYNLNWQMNATENYIMTAGYRSMQLYKS